MGVKVHGVGFALNKGVGNAVGTKGIIGSDDRNGLGGASVRHGHPADTVISVVSDVQYVRSKQWLSKEKQGRE